MSPWANMPRGYKTLEMLNSTEHEINYARKRLILMSRIIMFKLSKPKNSFDFDYFDIYAQLEYHAQLS